MNILWWILIVNYQSTAWYRQHSKFNGFGLCIRCTILGCWKVTIRCCRLMSGGSWRCWVLRWSRMIFLLMFAGRVPSWFWRWRRSWKWILILSSNCHRNRTIRNPCRLNSRSVFSCLRSSVLFSICIHLHIISNCRMISGFCILPNWPYRLPL